MTNGTGSFAGKSALVTGGASGIGLAVVSKLRAEGADVLIVDRDETAAADAARETGSRHFAADVSDPAAMSAAVDAAEEHFGGLHLAHLNAGVVTGESDVVELTDDAYRRALSVNVDGVVFGVRAVVPLIERSGGGAIAVTGSLASLVAYPVDPIYALTKHAVMGFARGIAQQLQNKGIAIGVVCPGFTRTSLLGEYANVFDGADFPLMEPEEVAATVVTSLSEAEPGAVYVCQPGRTCERYRFRGVPGPRVEGGAPVGPPPEPATS